MSRARRTPNVPIFISMDVEGKVMHFERKKHENEISFTLDGFGESRAHFQITHFRQCHAKCGWLPNADARIDIVTKTAAATRPLLIHS